MYSFSGTVKLLGFLRRSCIVFCQANDNGQNGSRSKLSAKNPKKAKSNFCRPENSNFPSLTFNYVHKINNSSSGKHFSSLVVNSHSPPRLCHHPFYVTILGFQELWAGRKCWVVSSIHEDIFFSSLNPSIEYSASKFQMIREMRIFRGPGRDRLLGAIMSAEPRTGRCHRNSPIVIATMLGVGSLQID